MTTQHCIAFVDANSITQQYLFLSLVDKLLRIITMLSQKTRTFWGP